MIYDIPVWFCIYCIVSILTVFVLLASVLILSHSSLYLFAAVFIYIYIQHVGARFRGFYT